jgi:lysophospholipase L1-like esterase
MSLQDHRLLLIIGAILLALTVFVGIELLLIAVNGRSVPTPTIPRQQQLGNGPPLNYLVLGDSSAVAQGTDYQHGFAYLSTQHLAKNNTVNLHNAGVSGARAKDVLTKQLPGIGNFKPDVVLIGVGGNDVTHLTSSGSFKSSLNGIIDGLAQLNCNVKIVMTGAPDMGSIPRFPQPLREIAGLRSVSLDKVANEVATKQNVTLAPIAVETGPTLRKNPQYFAQDNFHLNADGYKLFVPVINRALDQAQRQPKHC